MIRKNEDEFMKKVYENSNDEKALEGDQKDIKSIEWMRIGEKWLERALKGNHK